MIRVQDKFKSPGERVGQALSISYEDSYMLTNAKGEVFIKVIDGATGEILFEGHKQNTITLDAGILAAILLRDPDSRARGMYMLAVGTGATGSLLSPDAPDPRQRKLNAEIARKAFSTKIFIDANGEPASVPTNIVDFLCTFNEGEAVGPLNEMGIISPISANPSVLNPNPDAYPTRDLDVDLSLFDILVNYLSYGCIVLPATARFSITWRITF